ncbi:hypothetical protein QWJ34_19590 [Saccharibacillus sp. CPCC 101409]|uniref:hypothetical protein n=1 Tax=Saccharibacillus sp. CPCC 101409 TaxID=3058041 RepID=UPI0026713994|nr:hypothetical protein [Saccharibacillus sp. CPCC 101409]MDO3411975.1 hypothetical protein [Saccharibacillus sp. CPCC 101409]
MTVKLKIKHLVLYILVPLLVLSAAAIWAPGAVQRYRAAQEPEAVHSRMLDEIQAASGQARLKLIGSEIVQNGEYDPYRFNVYAGSSMTQSSSEDESLLTPQERLPLLEQYVREASPDSGLGRAAEQLAYEYDALGRSGDADAMLAEAERRMSEYSYERRSLALTRAERALAAGDAAAAEELLDPPGRPHEADRSEPELLGRQSWVRARLLFVRGQPEAALAEAQRGLKEYNELERKAMGLAQPEEESGAETAESEEESFGQRFNALTANQLDALAGALRTAIGRGGDLAPASLSGTLKRSDGTPVARAGIFLRSAREVNHSEWESEPYHVVTDDEGRFEIRNLVPGAYQIQLGFGYGQVDGWSWPVESDDWLQFAGGGDQERDITLQPLIQLKSPVNDQQLTDDSIEFSWEAVKGAAYYTLTGTIPSSDGGGSSSITIREHISGSRITLSAEDLYSIQNILFFSGSGEDWETADTSSLLGFLNPQARFSWSVQAYDKTGNRISQSNGYRLNPGSMGNLPFFYMKQRQLSEADRLVLDGKLVKALEAYRARVEADPQDVEALRMQLRLTQAESSPSDTPFPSRENIALLERLMELSPSSNTASQLADYFYEQADWKEYDRYYGIYLDSAPDDSEAYALAKHASSLLYRGDPGGAHSEFAAAMAKDDSHRFIGAYLLAELAADRALASVRELAQRYPDLDTPTDSDRWRRMLDAMDKERSAEPAAFDKSLRKALDLYLAARAKDPRSGASSQKSGFASIDAFLLAAGEVR